MQLIRGLLTRQLTLFSLIFIVLGHSTTAYSVEEEDYMMAFAKQVPTIVKGNTAFALELYAKLKENKNKNLFFSPYSLSTALAMTYAGAKGNTAKQMSHVLHFPENQETFHPAFGFLQQQIKEASKNSKIELNIANTLWTDITFSFLDEFKHSLERYYDTKPKRLDFKKDTEKARQTINEWVTEKTRRKIRELVKKGLLTPLTRLMLVNAISFKGDWLHEFDLGRTKDAPFFLLPNQQVLVPMMYQKNRFNYMVKDGLQALELPYTEHLDLKELPLDYSDTLSMIILLPQRRDGLEQLESLLNVDNLKSWLEYLRPQKVNVSLPKFKISVGFELSKKLEQMGMSDAFNDKADFSGIVKQKTLYLSSVIHQAFVEINEKGTEAAAATGVAIGVRGMSPSIPIFRADHPFIFLIRHKLSGSILFMGRVINPQ